MIIDDVIILQALHLILFKKNSISPEFGWNQFQPGWHDALQIFTAFADGLASRLWPHGGEDIREVRSKYPEPPRLSLRVDAGLVEGLKKNLNSISAAQSKTKQNKQNVNFMVILSEKSVTKVGFSLSRGSEHLHQISWQFIPQLSCQEPNCQPEAQEEKQGIVKISRINPSSMLISRACLVPSGGFTFPFPTAWLLEKGIWSKVRFDF